MNRTTKLILLFLPLDLLICGIIIGIWDLKNPVLNTEEQCTVAGVGSLVLPEERKIIYGQGGDSIHNITVDCNNSGKLWLNDPEVFRQSSIQVGQTLTLKHRQFHFIPQRWDFKLYPFNQHSNHQ